MQNVIQWHWNSFFKARGHKKNSRARPKTKDTTRKFSPKKKVFAQRIEAFSKKKNVFRKFFASSLAFFKTKQNWAWPWPIFNKSKIALSSSREQGICEDLQASRPRPRTWSLRPRPRTSNYVLETKDVLEVSTSANKDRHSGSLFFILFYYFYLKTNSERINCQACTIVTSLSYSVTLFLANWTSSLVPHMTIPKS